MHLEMKKPWTIEKVRLNLQLASVALLLVVALLASTLLSRPSRAKLSYAKEGRQFDKTMEVSKEKFLEVPHIVWGLNNQKIAIARAALTARYLNRTLIAPTLSSSVFINSSDAMPFTNLFSIPSFNHRCEGFVKIIDTPSVSARESNLDVAMVMLGSGRKWTTEKDKQHLRALTSDGYEGVAIIKMVGRNPFLWPDHWPVQDYASVLECLILTDSLQSKVDRVVRKLRRASSEIAQPLQGNGTANRSATDLKPGYVAVHMRVERDWRLHCRHIEDRALRMTKTRPHICASKEEIVRRVSVIPQLPKPAVVYLAMADAFLEDTNIMQGWGEDMVPFEKKKLGVKELYQKLPYIMQSAIDFEICKLADVFAGNSFSTFSSLVVMARTMKMKRRGVLNGCGTPMPSFAYNIGGPRPWVTNMSEPTLEIISYGSDKVGCLQPHAKTQRRAALGSQAYKKQTRPRLLHFEV
ncbi:hypothetical protein M758_10G131600 [Ceratodon purpureus]|nr:hypothetical protein M758_10G131600 [Ceratodon purpureus]